MWVCRLRSWWNRPVSSCESIETPAAFFGVFFSNGPFATERPCFRSETSCVCTVEGLELDSLPLALISAYLQSIETG